MYISVSGRENTKAYSRNLSYFISYYLFITINNYKTDQEVG